MDNPLVDYCKDGITISGCSGLLKIDGGALTNLAQHGLHGNTAQGSMTDLDLVVRGTTIRGVASRAVTLPALKSYDIDVDIDTAAQGLNTGGSAALSRVRARMRSVTTPWIKGGSDTLLVANEIMSDVAVGFSGVRMITISADSVTAFMDWHWVDTEATAATDDLDTINGGYDGRRLTLFAANASRDVVLKDNTGNLRLNGDFLLSQIQDSITLMYRAGDSSWRGRLKSPFGAEHAPKFGELSQQLKTKPRSLFEGENGRAYSVSYRRQPARVDFGQMATGGYELSRFERSELRG